MKNSIYIDQLTLEFWVDRKLDPKQFEKLEGESENDQRYLKHKFDAVDALLVSFIADLNPADEAVKTWMYKGHFLIKLDWLQERLPILQLKTQALYIRLRWLKMMGILDCIHRTVDGNKTLAYYKPSKFFWEIRDKRHAAASKAAKETDEKAIVHTYDGSEKSHSTQVHEPSYTGTSKAIQDSHLLAQGEETPPLPFEGAGGSPSDSRELKTRSAVTKDEQQHILQRLAETAKAQREKGKTGRNGNGSEDEQDTEMQRREGETEEEYNERIEKLIFPDEIPRQMKEDIPIPK